MAFKIIKKCQGCKHDCKQETHESTWESATVLSCPGKRKFKKK